MNLKEQFDRIVKQHDDTEDGLVLSEGDVYPYLREMLPVEKFLKKQWLDGIELFWDYTGMEQEIQRFRKLPASMNIQFSRHFRYDSSSKHTHDYFQMNYIPSNRHYY